jgi:hypothetical protein
MEQRSSTDIADGRTRQHEPANSLVGALPPKRDLIVGVLRHGEPMREPEGARPTIRLHADARTFLDKIIKLPLVPANSIDHFLRERGDRLAEYTTGAQIGQALVQAGLLTSYQLGRVLAGSTHGLVLGNYRVLDTVGGGGMGVVFLAEHSLMKRRVAVKVLPVDDDCPPSVRQRFYAEMRVLAELCHAHIVLAFDAGEVVPAGTSLPELIYLVMELVEGGDLERHVLDNGRCDVAKACHFIHQAASGLQAAHDRHLVHRDIKPSNILLSSAGQIKLVDFGLARQFCPPYRAHQPVRGAGQDATELIARQ